MRILFARKPGESADTEGTFPIRLTKSMAASSVAADVWRPEMISTPFCIGTGFIKCVLITRLEADVFVGSSLHVADAIFVMLILEVFVARMAWGGQIFASCSKMDSLREGISGTASITKSTV